MSNQSIRCTVDSCRYNDKISYCTLEDISVGKSVKSEPHQKDETQCSSFEY